MIDVSDLRKAYGGRTVLQLPRWQVAAGGTCCVTGPSGSGKSTLLEILCGLRRPSSGTVEVAGTVPAQLSEAAADHWRSRTVGVVTQAPHLLEILSVAENVAPAASMADSPLDPARLSMLLDQLKIGHLAHRAPGVLSQGERQRVVLARALLCAPRLVVADEPTSHLDDDACDALCQLMRRCCADAGASLVVATHDRCTMACFTQQLRLAPVAAAAQPEPE
jgi:ABC-type lipoprotein export system ATPase subunit